MPVFRGHLLTDEDRLIRQHILNIMCQFETTWDEPDWQFPELDDCLRKLDEMKADGLVRLEQQKLIVPEPSRPFVRNICMAFDLRLLRNAPDTRIFSMTI